VSNYDKPFEVGVGNTLFVGFPTSLPVSAERRDMICTLSAKKKLNLPLLEFVHVVFALRRGKDIHNVKSQFTHVSSLYAAALKQEEV
jgi:hypothetical protein